VYICLLNVNANHFILLEINKQTKMIYHYDLIASCRVIHRKTRSTLVRQVVEVSGFGQTI
jgi:predicted enzyme involved in methoxymalonyl-ACP biosynthesis